VCRFECLDSVCDVPDITGGGKWSDGNADAVDKELDMICGNEV
jgi:hypothetical protein